MKTCIACGMPMTKPSDYPMQDESKNYCVYCAKEDGSMQSYPEKLESMIHFFQKTQGLCEEAAKESAIHTLEKLPAWQKKAPNKKS